MNYIENEAKMALIDPNPLRLVDGDAPRSTSYGVNIFQLIRFARLLTSMHVIKL